MTETVQLDREHVVGLVSEEGTRTAHAAILAHSLGIPAVMGLGVDLGEITTRSSLSAGLRVALDLLNLQVVSGNGSR